MSGVPFVSFLIAAPVLGAVVCFFLPGGERGLRPARWLALGTAAATTVVSWVLVASYGGGGMAYEERLAWIPSVGVSYHVGLDGLNVVLVALTALLTFCAVLASWDAMGVNPRLFAALLLLLEATVIGALSALDLILYFVFWEAMLIPMYLLIAAYGGARRGYAALKFFIYTSVGSLVMLLAILGTVFLHGGTLSFDLRDLAGGVPGVSAQRWLFLAFTLAFAIKLPLFPFHSWLADAYTQAPLTVLVLATMLVKVAAYSFLRFAFPLFPVAAADLTPWLALLATIGIIYGAVIAVRQRDVVRLLAFSSMSHLGFIALGLFALNQQAAQGSLLQMVNHGLSSGALFVLAGMVLSRTGTLDMAALGGLAQRWPVLAGCLTLAAFASLGLPGLNGFVGEFLILLGTFETQRAFAIVASTGVLLAAVYLLRLVAQILHGPARLPESANAHRRDLDARELLALAPLLILIVWIGVYPAPFLRRSEAAVSRALSPSQLARGISAERPDCQSSSVGCQEPRSVEWFLAPRR